jgi:hypothetical protein
MIVRSWRGYADAVKAPAYSEHLLGSIRPKLELLAGFRGLYRLRRQLGSELEFRVLTTTTRSWPLQPDPLGGQMKANLRPRSGDRVVAGGPGQRR